MKPEFITRNKVGWEMLIRRVPTLGSGVLSLLPPRPDRRASFEANFDWEIEHDWLINYHVYREDKPRAVELVKLIDQAAQSGDREMAQRLLEELRRIRFPDSSDVKGPSSWDYRMAQMPEDMGGPNKSKIRNFLSRRHYGRVLEAMCGFRTYYNNSRKREVVGMDWSREALERYPAGRTRILFDLNDMDESGLEFLGLASFDVISICFGWNYLKDPPVVFREFGRVLKPGGRLTLVENPHQGYWELAFQKKGFDEQRALRFLREAGGFGPPSIRELNSVSTDWEKHSGGHYYFVEALKT